MENYTVFSMCIFYVKKERKNGFLVSFSFQYSKIKNIFQDSLYQFRIVVVDKNKIEDLKIWKLKW